MPDFRAFNEGKDWIINNDVSGATWYFLLSSQAIGVGELEATDTLAGGVGEIAGWTGASAYARISQAVPAPSNGVITFSEITWQTGAATDGPASVKSVVLVTSADGTGKAIGAWHIEAGGTADDFSLANVTLNVTPTLFLKNTDE
jgi:hypothetical protein